jgi:hypothetical protein
MLKTTILSVFVGGVVVVSAAFPHGLIVGTDSAMPESGAMLLLAITMFWIAAVFRRHGKGPRQR